MENDPRFLQRIQSARQNIKSGRGVRLEDIFMKFIVPNYQVGNKYLIQSIRLVS
ncbi:hypothetical protein BGP_2678 [Beggiatoa sp. PS]|nr:hypothetical protein BGP_2678 [Beggiatoa sp. PS]